MLHRDLKTTNVVVWRVTFILLLFTITDFVIVYMWCIGVICAGPVAKLTDFGLSRNKLEEEEPSILDLAILAPRFASCASTVFV